VAWLSLDENDRQPAVFWTYVITALQTAVPGVGVTVLPLLQSAQPQMETVLAAVLNELAAAPKDIDLVLDDYHLVDGPDLRDGMTFLLEHLPHHVHLVISSRADPLLPLARLRARGELVEVRAADLRFTPDEVTAYLNDIIGLDLAPDDIAALDVRTEGWIAALQLAALSMQGRDDVGLQHVREEVVVADTSGGCRRAGSKTGSRGPALPGWPCRRGHRSRHRTAGRSTGPASRCGACWSYQWLARRCRSGTSSGRSSLSRVELAIPALRRSRQEATIRGWLDVIPYELVRMRPVLAVGLVGGLMVGAETEGVEQRLRDAERWLQPATPDHPGSQALVLHSICAVIYAVLGGFQFSSALRRLRSGWYRAASGIT